jgi:peptidoglycan hydrolase-like protein with peptidoglycan-binding domain
MKGEDQAPKRRVPAMRARTLALVAAGGVAAVVAVVIVSGRLSSDTSADAAPAAAATATVARRDLVQRSTVSGTLGYDDTRELVNSRSGTITSLPEEGRVLSPGAVVYRVDERPVVLLAGSKPAWRPLAEGVSDGRDVRQLEQNLRTLGYDDERELAIDEHFDGSTAAVVKRWQEDLGLEATGRIEPGGIVFLPGARRVGTVAVSLGDRAGPGRPVMATSSTRRLVTAEIDASDQQDVAVGDNVTIDLRNGTTTTGTISEVGRVASAPKDESGGQMTCTATTSTLLALSGGRYAVEVVRSGATSVVEVTPGLYSDGGYVEIKRGAVKAGDVVVVPA